MVEPERLASGAPSAPSRPSFGGGLTFLSRAFQAFRYRDFRLMWLGALTSTTGTWMQQVAESWVVLALTDSAFYLCLTAFLLTGLLITNLIQIWHFLVLVFVVGSAQAFGGPAYQALLPGLVRREDVPNAIALVVPRPAGMLSLFHYWRRLLQAQRQSSPNSFRSLRKAVNSSALAGMPPLDQGSRQGRCI